MKNKLFNKVLLGIALLLMAACKNPPIGIESFKIIDEKIDAEVYGAKATGVFSFEGKMREMKMNVGLDESLTDAVEYVVELDDHTFSAKIDNLNPNTTYYYNYGIDFGGKEDYLTEVNSFTTLQGPPLVKTVDAVAITALSYQVKCEVISDGGADIIERGIYWDTYGDPDMNDHIVRCAENGVGEYICIMDSLAPNTYFARAYARNALGTGVGDTVRISTGNGSEVPEVRTLEVLDITAISARCGFKVVSDGGSPIIKCGVCWSTGPYPTTDNDTTITVFGWEELYSNLTELVPNTSYNVCAYATNSNGDTGYGEPLPFTTKDGLPKLITHPVTDINAEGRTAIGHGEVTDQGASGISERGICWALTHNPDTTDNYEPSEMEADLFSVTMDELSPNQTYYVRAYARNAQGIAYSDNEVYFKIENGNTIGDPDVVIDSVGGVSSSSATVYCTLRSDGGDGITDLGIYWGTGTNPIVDGTRVPYDDVSNVFSFSIPLDNLSPSTTYYVQAFASNSLYTGYSETKDFRTTSLSSVTAPTVITYDVTDITSNTAYCGGSVTDNGGAEVTEYGLCWSTHPDPVIYHDDTIHCGGGSDDFSGTVTDLLPGTTYYLKAYAVNSFGVGYGRRRMFTTLENPEHPEGALDSVFSVSSVKKVWFSKGNLQYLATSNKWQFADNQYDYIGGDNSNISPTYDGWIDLFGWGTSGYDNHQPCYEPYSISANSTDYYDGNLTGTTDWGYNAIVNGGNEENKGWRTLKSSEWDYLLNQRQTPSNKRYAKAMVNGINGLIILPDNWDESFFNLNNTNESGSNYNNNVIAADIWTNQLEAHGAVFLPAGGKRRINNGIEIYLPGRVGYYWSSIKDDATNAYYLYFNENNLNAKYSAQRCHGNSVRLVFDKP